jgi:hypothetical protein
MLGIRRSHVIGILVGGLLGAVVSGLIGLFGLSMALNEAVLWGAAIGGLLAGIPQFAQSGAVITQNPDSAWNPLIGLAGGLLIFGGLLALVAAVWSLIF